MIKEKIVVPACVRFISDWEKLEGGYSLANYQYPHIVNKQITGCGFTEYCLTNRFNIVLCSPRKLLLENKETQHGDEVLYVNNILGNFSESGYDLQSTSKNLLKELSMIEETLEEENISSQGKVAEMERSIRDYISRRAESRLPYKILVTYDSFRHVRRVLESMKLLDTFFVVVDEFQSIFVDSRFKSSTELEFTNQLRGLQRLCFVSATPMMDKYLEMLDEFKDLPYYEFDWASEKEDRVVSPRLEVKATKSLLGEASRIILSYLSGNFIKHIYKDSSGKSLREIESKEAVLYFNSVKSICMLIKKFNLSQDICNILCARTRENEEKIRKAFGVTKKEFNGLGHIPKKGEPHKMFTFCTRTVYLGADFYSTNARSFVFSDANIDSLAVDISLDLPQILGRQRLTENPWKNSAEFYFKPLDEFGAISEEDFLTRVEEKKKSTEILLKALDNMDHETQKKIIEKYERDAKTNNYKTDYVSVNRHAGSQPIPVFNNLVMVAEQRAYDIQQVDFRDRFKVFSALQNSNVNYDISSETITESLAIFDNLPTFVDKMKSLCTNEIFTDQVIQIILNSVPIQYYMFYQALGPETITRLSYQKSKLVEEYQRLVNNESVEVLVKDAILRSFLVGHRYTSNRVKNDLKTIYEMFDYRVVPKATNLKEYFELKDVLISMPDGKMSRGFEILSIK